MKSAGLKQYKEFVGARHLPKFSGRTIKIWLIIWGDIDDK